MEKKILVIEDEKKLLANIAILLRAEKYDVINCSNGKEGIRLAKELKPNLIICDIMMPGVDGYQVIKELNNDNDTSSIPFLFLTAKVEKCDLRKGMELGADDYIFKPFKSEELLKAIETRLKRFEVIKAKILENQGKINKDIRNTKKYKPDESILLQMHNSSFLISIDKIKYIAANNQYTYLVLDENKHVLIRRSIKKWEQALPENIFVRVHRSTIINIHYINQIERLPNYIHKIFLKDTSKTFNISRRYFRKLKVVI